MLSNCFLGSKEVSGCISHCTGNNQSQGKLRDCYSANLFQNFLSVENLHSNDLKFASSTKIKRSNQQNDLECCEVQSPVRNLSFSLGFLENIFHPVVRQLSETVKTLYYREYCRFGNQDTFAGTFNALCFLTKCSKKLSKYEEGSRCFW